MYVGVATAQLGFFLALPSLFSLICLAVGLYALYKQIAVEEAHLVTRFNDDYLKYKQTVPRWL